MTAIQKLRDEINTPLVVVSGFRTPRYNEFVGGAEKSEHMFGRAIDIKIPKDYTTEQIKNIFVDVNGSDFGIGLYDTFIHIDSGTKRTWDERGK